MFLPLLGTQGNSTGPGRASYDYPRRDDGCLVATAADRSAPKHMEIDWFAKYRGSEHAAKSPPIRWPPVTATVDKPICTQSYGELVNSLQRRCSTLKVERDAAVEALGEVRRDLIEQQVARMEDGVKLEDTVARLESALAARIDSQRRSERKQALQLCLLHELHSLTSAPGRKRKRWWRMQDVGHNRKRRRC